MADYGADENFLGLLRELISRNGPAALNLVLDEYVGFDGGARGCVSSWEGLSARYCLGCEMIIVSENFPVVCSVCDNALCSGCSGDPSTVAQTLGVLCRRPGCANRLCTHHPQIATCSDRCDDERNRERARLAEAVDGCARDLEQWCAMSDA